MAVFLSICVTRTAPLQTRLADVVPGCSVTCGCGTDGPHIDRLMLALALAFAHGWVRGATRVETNSYQAAK